MYGWRIYAIPVLAVVTVLVIVDSVRGSGASSESAATTTPTPAPHETGVIGPKANGKFDPTIASYALPAGGDFQHLGKGTFHTVPGTTDQIGSGTIFTYVVEVEDDNDTTALGGDQAFGSMVDKTLANPKGWTNKQEKAAKGFRRIDTGTPDIRIALATQETARTICGFEIPVDTSCYDQAQNRVVITTARWVRGAVAFEGDIGSYRQYVINHEVGHAIGYHGHAPCEASGKLAPIMMQQTFGTANNDVAVLDPAGVVPKDGKVCKANAWPYPTG